MPSPIELVTSSAEETRAIGQAVAALLRPGDVVSLTGDLGAGKTTFVQGASAGLGVTDRVLSPTFTLIREYEGANIRVYHFDIYRLDRIREVVDLGLDEILESGGVVFIEWGDAVEALLPSTFLQVELTLGAGDEERLLSLSPRGVGWADRTDRLAGLLDAWRASGAAR